MATLQKIRNNAGLLVSIVIGIALLAFIAGDLLKSGNTLFGSNKNTIAEIAGKDVPVQFYQNKVDETIESYKRNTGQSAIDEGTTERLKDQTWDQITRDFLMQDEYKEIGITLCGDELFDMVQGNNIDPQIMQIPIFKDEATGQFDRNLVIRFLKNKDLDESGKTQASWASFEKALSAEKLKRKYDELIKKGLYTTSFQAKNEVVNKNKKVDFDYVMIRYNTTPDSAISVTDADLKKYYNAHKEDFEQEESREINYVTFPVIASEDDIKQTEKWISDIKGDFATTENDIQFADLNSDVPFQDIYLTKDEMPTAIADLFDAKEDSIYGPYRDGNSFKISKVVKSINVPDSVKARHILLKPESQEQYTALKLQADSLVLLIEKGADFAKLAEDFSVDGSASKGGDLGWFTEGAMVKPFNDACFFGKKGGVKIVESQFGIHIIEVTNQAKTSKKVQLATIEHFIEPSSETYQKVYAVANEFGGKNRTIDEFRKAAEKANINIKIATLKRNDKKVANLESSRSLVKWAYKQEEGDISNEVFDYSDTYVVVALKTVNEKGFASFDNAKIEIEHKVKNEKKAEYLASKMKEAQSSAGTLQQVAEKLNTQLKETKGATFQAYSLPGIGYEPKLQAYATMLAKDKISEPIKGENGVYIITVKNIIEPATDLPIDNERNMITRSNQARVSYQVFNAIKEAANITDNRSNFY